MRARDYRNSPIWRWERECASDANQIAPGVFVVSGFQHIAVPAAAFVKEFNPRKWKRHYGNGALVIRQTLNSINEIVGSIRNISAFKKCGSRKAFYNRMQVFCARL